MSLRTILQIGDPRLRRIAQPVDPTQLGEPMLQRLIDDMVETMRAASGAGLAAPQVGASLRICVVEVRNNPRYPTLPDIPLTVFVNPVIHIHPGLDLERDVVEMYEGCLSVPGLRGKVRRPRKLDLDCTDRHGTRAVLQFEGPAASVIQHELDHLDGTLFVDRCW